MEKYVEVHKLLKSEQETYTYSDIAHFENRLSHISEYKNDIYLSNCKTLDQEFAKVNERYASMHLAYMNSQIERLREYQMQAEEYFSEIVIPEVTTVLQEYKQTAAKYYSSEYVQAYLPLEEKALKLVNEAAEYFAINQ